MEDSKLEIESQVAQTRFATSAAALGRLELCVELYHGELLTDFYDDWIAAEREKYHALYQTACLGLRNP